MSDKMTEYEQKCVDTMRTLMSNRPDLVNQLSPAQIDVCCLRAAGLNERHIAELLYRSAHTIHDHVKAIHKRLNVHNSNQLTLLFVMPHTAPGAVANA